ncbi:MAG: taurine catabolism dioxygenase TauD [Rhodospirillaceae bacterium]|nr:taurine catabolism dioxygenase TauD [Rhodospirillaceae bacterium]
MAITLRPLTPAFGAKITGVDLRDLDEVGFRTIQEAFEEYSLLLFPAQELDDPAQIDFTSRFGPLEKTYPNIGNNFRTGYVACMTNLDEHGKLLAEEDPRVQVRIGQRFWHTDSSFKRVPATASLLHARVLPPEGGETEFASMRVAYESLSEDQRKALDGLKAVHHYAYSRRHMDVDLTDQKTDDALPPVPQALIRQNPTNGRKNIYVSGHASHIQNMDDAEGRLLLDELMALCTRPEFTYSHSWSLNDLIMYDNRTLLHRARSYDITRYPRILHRTTLAGSGPAV